MKVMEFILVDLVCFLVFDFLFCNIVGSLDGILGLERSFICSLVKQVEKFCFLFYPLRASCEYDMIWVWMIEALCTDDFCILIL